MTTRFVLLTVARLGNGYRLIAATPCCADRYIWRLWRNRQLIARQYTRSTDNVVALDLIGAIAPGDYRISVDCVTHVRNNFQRNHSPRSFSTRAWIAR